MILVGWFFEANFEYPILTPKCLDSTPDSVVLQPLFFIMFSKFSLDQESTGVQIPGMRGNLNKLWKPTRNALVSSLLAFQIAVNGPFSIRLEEMQKELADWSDSPVPHCETYPFVRGWRHVTFDAWELETSWETCWRELWKRNRNGDVYLFFVVVLYTHKLREHQ